MDVPGGGEHLFGPFLLEINDHPVLSLAGLQLGKQLLFAFPVGFLIRKLDPQFLGRVLKGHHLFTHQLSHRVIANGNPAADKKLGVLGKQFTVGLLTLWEHDYFHGPHKVFQGNERHQLVGPGGLHCISGNHSPYNDPAPVLDPCFFRLLIHHEIS